DLTAEDVERFWNELVPLAAQNRHDLDTLPDLCPDVRARYPRKQLRALHRLLARFSLMLVAHWEPAYLGRGITPLIPVDTYFHLWMLAQHIIGNGKDAYLKALAE